MTVAAAPSGGWLVSPPFVARVAVSLGAGVVVARLAYQLVVWRGRVPKRVERRALPVTATAALVLLASVTVQHVLDAPLVVEVGVAWGVGVAALHAAIRGVAVVGGWGWCRREYWMLAWLATASVAVAAAGVSPGVTWLPASFWLVIYGVSILFAGHDAVAIHREDASKA